MDGKGGMVVKLSLLSILFVVTKVLAPVETTTDIMPFMVKKSGW